MALELVLNELSLRQLAPSVYAARNSIAHFTNTIRAAALRGCQPALHTDRELASVELALEYPIRRWLNDPEVDRDLRDFFLSVAVLYPYLRDLPQLYDRALRLDCSYQETLAYGLLTAFLMDALALSFPSEPNWMASTITVEVRYLSDDGDLLTSTEVLRHGSHPTHINEHNTWITDRIALPDPHHGRELWIQCSRRYPHLRFCPRIEGQLINIGTGHPMLRQIIKTLAELENFTSSWRTGPFTPKALPGKITPESKVTLQKYELEHTFQCPDGEMRIFSWHARFTPGDGRIFFFPDEQVHTIIIGHIGGKLPTVETPT